MRLFWEVKAGELWMRHCLRLVRQLWPTDARLPYRTWGLRIAASRTLLHA